MNQCCEKFEKLFKISNKEQQSLINYFLLIFNQQN